MDLINRPQTAMTKIDPSQLIARTHCFPHYIAALRFATANMEHLLVNYRTIVDRRTGHKHHSPGHTSIITVVLVAADRAAMLATTEAQG